MLPVSDLLKIWHHSIDETVIKYRLGSILFTFSNAKPSFWLFLKKIICSSVERKKYYKFRFDFNSVSIKIQIVYVFNKVSIVLTINFRKNNFYSFLGILNMFGLSMYTEL